VATALDIISGRKEAGYKAIIVGGGMVGCETAEFLAQQGRKVIILEMMGEVGSDIEPITRSRILQRLGKAGVRIKNQAEVMEITKKGVKVALERKPSFFEADTVVLACGMELNFQLAKDLNGKVSELHTIGDCVKPGKIVSAIGDGARVGREI
jgi:pyruvate/2-oxoglutarate dehydrogenase complex dihydrolipoamide dehydrogenase (E3) component